MTTTKPPVLTDEEIGALTIRAIDDGWTFRRVILATEQAVLERAGADAVRDAAQINHHTGGRYISYIEHPADCEVSYPEDEQFTARVRPALKVTPAAAVAQPTRISDDDRMTLAGTLGLLRGHRYTGSADALQRVLDADAASVPAELSGNAGEVEALATQIKDDLQCQFDTDGITEIDSGDALIRLSEALNAVDEAANAASKGANHG